MNRSQTSLLVLLTLVCTHVPADEQVVNITTTALSERLFYPHYSAPATTQSLNDSRISAETSGHIKQISVRIGDQVTQGDPLASLDCRDNRLLRQQAESRLKSAAARLTLAQRQINRTLSLRKDRNVSEELLNQREADVKIARAERETSIAALESARLNEQRCHITTPFSGIVMERLASEGEWINPGQPLIRLLDNERLEVSAQIPLDQVESLKQGEGVTLKINDSFPLTLSRIVPAIDTRGRHQEVRLEFTADKALPGSAGRVTWTSTTPHLPADIIQRRGEQLGVFLLEGDKAHFHPLPHALEGHPAPVDLAPDSRLIIEGHRGLRDGQSVKVR